MIRSRLFKLHSQTVEAPAIDIYANSATKRQKAWTLPFRNAGPARQKLDWGEATLID